MLEWSLGVNMVAVPITLYALWLNDTITNKCNDLAKQLSVNVVRITIIAPPEKVQPTLKALLPTWDMKKLNQVMKDGVHHHTQVP